MDASPLANPITNLKIDLHAEPIKTQTDVSLESMGLGKGQKGNLDASPSSQGKASLLGPSSQLSSMGAVLPNAKVSDDLLAKLEPVDMSKFPQRSSDGNVLINHDNNVLYVRYDTTTDGDLETMSELQNYDDHSLSPKPKPLIGKSYVKDENGDVFKAYEFNVRLFPKPEKKQMEQMQSDAAKYDKRNGFGKMFSSSSVTNAKANLESYTKDVLDPKPLQHDAQIRKPTHKLLMRNDCGRVANVEQQIIGTVDPKQKQPLVNISLEKIDASTCRELENLRLQPGDKMVVEYTMPNPFGRVPYHAATVVMATSDYVVTAEGHVSHDFRELDLHIYPKGALGFLEGNLDALAERDDNDDGAKYVKKFIKAPAQPAKHKMDEYQQNALKLKSALASKDMDATLDVLIGGVIGNPVLHGMQELNLDAQQLSSLDEMKLAEMAKMRQSNMDDDKIEFDFDDKVDTLNSELNQLKDKYVQNIKASELFKATDVKKALENLLNTSANTMLNAQDQLHDALDESNPKLRQYLGAMITAGDDQWKELAAQVVAGLD